MLRLRSLLWLPALAAFGLAPAVQRPVAFVPAEITLAAISHSGSPGHALPAPRHPASLHFRSPSERQSGPHWAMVPAPGGIALVLQAPAAAWAEDANFILAGSHRHFPLFPTGPPSQG